MLLGAGGAGAAVAHAVLTLGARQLTVFDVDAERARRLVGTLGERFGPNRAKCGNDLRISMRGAEGLIHATPTGMAKYPGLPLPVELLTPAMWVADIVYVPLETVLLREARRLGCRTLDGQGMAVFQAVEAFRLFTDVVPDAERMRGYFNSMVTLTEKAET
jgi:shikimate dehydrogenase